MRYLMTTMRSLLQRPTLVVEDAEMVKNDDAKIMSHNDTCWHMMEMKSIAMAQKR